MAPSYYQLNKTNAGADAQSLTSQRTMHHNCLVTQQITVISSWKGVAPGCVGHNRLVYLSTAELCLRKCKDKKMLLFSEQQQFNCPFRHDHKQSSTQQYGIHFLI